MNDQPKRGPCRREAPPTFQAAPPLSGPPRPGLSLMQAAGLIALVLLGIAWSQALLNLGALCLGGKEAPLSPTLILCVNQWVMFATALQGFRMLAIPWGEAFSLPEGAWQRGAPLLLLWLAFLTLELPFLHWLQDRWPAPQGLPAEWGNPLAIFPLILMGPLAEEAFFRGVLCEGLARSHGNALGIGLSSLLFALAHGNAFMMPGCFLFGVITGLLRRRTGSLHLGLLIHMLNNTLALITH